MRGGRGRSSPRSSPFASCRAAGRSRRRSRPARARRTGEPSTTASAVPDSIRKNSSPCSPCRKTTSPAGTRRSSSVRARSSSVGRGSGAKIGELASRSTRRSGTCAVALSIATSRRQVSSVSSGSRAPTATSVQRIPIVETSTGAVDRAERNRDEQDAVEDAEDAGEHLAWRRPLQQRVAGDADDRAARADHRHQDERERLLRPDRRSAGSVAPTARSRGRGRSQAARALTSAAARTAAASPPIPADRVEEPHARRADVERLQREHDDAARRTRRR